MVLRLRRARGSEELRDIAEAANVLRAMARRPAAAWLFPGERPGTNHPGAVGRACHRRPPRAHGQAGIATRAPPCSLSISSRRAPTCARFSSCSIGACRPRHVPARSRPPSARPRVRGPPPTARIGTHPGRRFDGRVTRRAHRGGGLRRYGDAFRTEVGAAFDGAAPRDDGHRECRTPLAATSSSVTTAVIGALVSCRNRHCPTCQSLARAAWLDRRRATCFHGILPRRLHRAAGGRRDRHPKQGWSTVSSSAPSPRRSAPSRRPPPRDRLLRRPPHLGTDARPSSASTCVIHSRGGLASDGSGWVSCPPRLLPAGPGPLALLPSGSPPGAAGRLRVRTAALRRPAAAPRRPRAFRRASARPARPNGWSTRSHPSPAPKRSSNPVAIPTGSPSATSACGLDDGSVRFRYTDYRRAGASRQKTMTLTAKSSSAACSSTCSRPASTAFATTASSPIAPAGRSSPSAGACCTRPR